MTRRAQTIVRELFEAYSGDPSLMPQEFSQKAAGVDGAERARVIADYIAGMTDRYAIAAHEGLAG